MKSIRTIDAVLAFKREHPQAEIVYGGCFRSPVVLGAGAGIAGGENRSLPATVLLGMMSRRLVEKTGEWLGGSVYQILDPSTVNEKEPIE